MRRFDKINHINTLNKKLNESNTIKESDVYGEEFMANQQGYDDKALGATKKM